MGRRKLFKEKEKYVRIENLFGDFIKTISFFRNLAEGEYLQALVVGLHSYDIDLRLYQEFVNIGENSFKERFINDNLDRFKKLNNKTGMTQEDFLKRFAKPYKEFVFNELRTTCK